MNSHEFMKNPLPELALLPLKIACVFAACTTLAGCMAFDLMKEQMEAPAHSHYDFETGTCFADPGYYEDHDKDGKLVFRKIEK